MKKQLTSFWSLSAAELLQELQTSPQGLTSAEAQERLGRYGLNRHQGEEPHRFARAFPRSIQEPDHSNFVVCRRLVSLSA